MSSELPPSRAEMWRRVTRPRPFAAQQSRRCSSHAPLWQREAGKSRSAASSRAIYATASSTRSEKSEEPIPADKADAGEGAGGEGGGGEQRPQPREAHLLFTLLFAREQRGDLGKAQIAEGGGGGEQKDERDEQDRPEDAARGVPARLIGAVDELHEGVQQKLVQPQAEQHARRERTEEGDRRFPCEQGEDVARASCPSSGTGRIPFCGGGAGMRSRRRARRR